MKPLKIFIISIILLSHSLSFSQADLSHPLEGPSDWSMFHYNAQHTGYNDKDHISLPLELKWHKKITEIDCPLEPITVVGDYMIVANEATAQSNSTVGRPTLNCMDVNTGAFIWADTQSSYLLLSIDQASYSNGNIYSQHIFGSGTTVNDSNRVSAFDLVTGVEHTRYHFNSQSQDYLGSVIDGNNLFFPAGYYSGLYSANISERRYNWWTPTIDRDLWTPSVYDSLVFVWLGTLLNVYDMNTVERIWIMYGDGRTEIQEEKGPTPFSMHTAPAIDTTNKMVYVYWRQGFSGINFETRQLCFYKIFDYDYWVVLSTPAVCEGMVYAIFFDSLSAMDGVTGEEVWHYKLDTASAFSPVIANGYLFVSTVNTTHVFDIETHELVWSYPDGGFLTIANNQLFIAGEKGDVYVFGNVPTDVEDEISPELPTDFVLSQNYPNPFNPETKIAFSIPETAKVNISIYNILGQKVRILTDRIYPAGNYTMDWNGKNDSGSKLPSGVYFYKLITDERALSKKMILLK